MLKNLFICIVLLIQFIGCSQKNTRDDGIKTAIFLYDKMLNELSIGQLDKADDTFSSLESEHRKSSLISVSILILANAHIDYDEYDIARYYLDEYAKRYANKNDIDYVEYLKIKTQYMSLNLKNRQQQLLYDTIEDINEYLKENQNSVYVFLLQTMQTKLMMAKSSFDNEIASLYYRINKDKAAKFYQEKAKKSFLYQEDLIEAKTPFYRSIFENGVF